MKKKSWLIGLLISIPFATISMAFPYHTIGSAIFSFIFCIFIGTAVGLIVGMEK